MKKLSSDGSTPLNLKMPPKMREAVAGLARQTRQPESAVIRAAWRYAQPIFSAHPQLVGQLESGAAAESQADAIIQRAILLAEKHSTSVDTVLAAAIRTGLPGLERRLDLDAHVLRAIASGLFEHPMFMKVIEQMNEDAIQIEKMIDEATAKLGKRPAVSFSSNTSPQDAKRVLDDIVAKASAPAPKPAAKSSKKKPGK